jgi:tetratricopeptide (TPR) repeat protein
MDDPAEFARLLKQPERAAEAVNVLTTMLAAAEKQFGPDGLHLAGLRVQLGKAFLNLDRPVDAEPQLRQSVRIYEINLGKNHPQVGAALSYLGAALERLGRFAEAESAHKRVIEIDEATYGREHPEVANDLINLAELYRSTNRPQMAEPLYRRALEISEKSLNPDETLIQRIRERLNHTAEGSGTSKVPDVNEILDDPQQRREMEKLFRGMLVDFENRMGPDDPAIAQIANTLGRILLRSGQTTEAEAMLRRALSIYQKVFGENHPRSAGTQRALGVLLAMVGRRSEAEQFLQRAVEINATEFGPTHPETMAVREELEHIRKGMVPTFLN